MYFNLFFVGVALGSGEELERFFGLFFGLFGHGSP